MKSIPYGRQNITKKDIQAFLKALNSDFSTQDPSVKEFVIALRIMSAQNMQ
jgi:hypothetical protein